MPKPDEKDKDIPLPPSSGPGSIRGRLADPSVLSDIDADPREQEFRLDQVYGQAATTAPLTWKITGEESR